MKHSLRGSNSCAHRNHSCPTLWILSLAAEEYSWRLFQRQRPTKSLQAKEISGSSETLADTPQPRWLLVKFHLGVHPGSFCTYSGPAERATNCGSLIAINRLLKASHRQHLTLTCTEVPLKRPQNQHTQWQCSENVRAGSN